MRLLVTIRLLSLAQMVKYIYKDSDKQNDVIDWYVVVTTFILLILLCSIPKSMLAVVVGIYWMSEMYSTTLAVLFVDKQDAGHKIRSADRSVVLGLIGYLELIIGFAILYLYFNAIHFPGYSYSLSRPVTSSIQAIYFSTVTITTLGYGDILPSNDIGKSLVVLETLLGIILIVCVLSKFLSSTKGLQSS